MKYICSFAAIFLAGMVSNASAVLLGGDILFVGNSFTHGNIAPVMTYNRNAITDANNTGSARQGGVPGIFKKLTDQAGLNFNVTIEAVSGQTLEYHLANKSPTIGQSKWEAVVLQEYSTRPVPASRGGEPDKFFDAVSSLKTLIGSSSAASIYLYETWARPDQVYPANSEYAGTSLQTMQTDLHNSYYSANAMNGLTGVSPVGDAFLRAISEGVGNPNPYSIAPAGTIDMWDTDHYHASKYGSYLSAAVMFREITGLDPRDLATDGNSAAGGLGISSADAVRLNTIAFEAVAVPEPTTLVGGIFVYAIARRRHRRAA